MLTLRHLQNVKQGLQDDQHGKIPLHAVANDCEYELHGVPIEKTVPPFPDDDTWLVCAFGGTQHLFSVPFQMRICTYSCFSASQPCPLTILDCWG